MEPCGKWEGPERRHDITLEVLKEMREWFAQHEKDERMKFDELQAEIRANRLDTEARHQEIVDRMEHMSKSTLNVINEQNHALNEIHALFRKAFPEGDAEKHRSAHEDWIARDKADKEFWLKLKQHVINWAVVALLGWGGLILWAGFLQGPK